MADGRTRYPVSGEIMTGAPDSQPAMRDLRATAGDIVDAEYEVVASAGTRRRDPPAAQDAAIASLAAPLAGMEMLRRPETPAAPTKAVRGGPMFWALGVGLAAAAFWVSGGHALVRSAPLFQEETQLRALGINGVISRVDTSGARPILLVDGEAANDGTVVENLPPLDIVVTGNDDRVTRYRLGTSRRPIGPGERFAFSSRLEVPKNGVKTVSVTFGE